MTRDAVSDWQALSALYEQADALDLPAQRAWLAQLRAESHPLLAPLEQMLAARARVQGNGFLDALPPWPARPEPRADAWAEGRRIGPYRLVRALGSGGMAEVWLAQRDDGAFQRAVAIKLLFRHAASTERDTLAQRFSRERDILATLHHPHIAALHDAGVTPDGQPWIALEYVQGEVLTAWCDRAQLDIEARVRLFRQVLLAVEHAHANLVIHRDLKPANILVTRQGEVRLLDFGIAKLQEVEGGALADTELTRQAGRPLTPMYASPEQLLGWPLTTACDVYSLGVVLYELLCGERPYELKAETAAQLEQAIVDAEPRPPSRRALLPDVAQARGAAPELLRKQLAPDLDAIALRALAKQPAHRYPSVEALRADLDRWLGNEPVLARVPSTAYRVRKFIGRHRLGVGLGAAALASLVGVAAIAVVMGLQARDESARAVAARDFMLNIFQRADQEKSRGADITARDLLEGGRKDVLTRLAGQPKLQAELLRGIAKIQTDMGEFATADGTYAELSKLYAVLHQPREAAFAFVDHAENAVRMSNPAVASTLLGQAKALAEKRPDDAELAARIAEVDGWTALSQGDASRARDLLAAAREQSVALLGEHRLASFRLGQALFTAQRDLRDFAGALALQQELQRVAPLVVGLNTKELAAMDGDLVDLLYSAGQFSQASEAARAALPRCVAAHGADERHCRNLMVKRWQTQFRLGHIDPVLGEADRIATLAKDRTSPVLQIDALLLQFRVQSAARPLADSAPLFEEVRAFGESGAELAFRPAFKVAALLALAEARLRAHDPLQAQRWIAAATVRLGPVGPARALGRLDGVARALAGVALVQQGQMQPGLDALQDAQSIFGQTQGKNHPMTQLFALNSAVALAELGRVSDAMVVVSRAEPVLREAFGADSPAYARVLRLRERLAAPAGRSRDHEFFS